MADDRTNQEDSAVAEEQRGSGPGGTPQEQMDIQASRNLLAEAAAEMARNTTSEEGAELPAVVLAVPTLKVDEINLKVEDLEARVSLHAELANMLELDIGAFAHLDHLNLEIKGVEAQAMLTVRLRTVADILDRVLTTIDNNPEILKSLLQPVGEAVGEVGEGAGEAVEDVGEGAGEAVDDVGEGAGEAVEDVGKGAGEAVEDVGEGAGGAVEDVGEGAGEATEDVGEGAGEAAGQAGDVAEEATDAAEGATDEATDAAGDASNAAKETAKSST